MSVNGYLCVEIDTDAKYEQEARRWADEHGYGVHSEKGRLTIETEFDTSYFSDLVWFEKEVADLGIPASDWTAHFHYTCEEGACEHGGNVIVTIANGKIESFLTSTIVMEESVPWFEFELEEEA